MFLLIFWLVCVVVNFFFTVGWLKTSYDEDVTPTSIAIVFILDIIIAPLVTVLFVSNIIWTIILSVKAKLKKRKRKKEKK